MTKNQTLTRSSGSWLDDGWKKGARLDGQVVSRVTHSTLTVRQPIRWLPIAIVAAVVIAAVLALALAKRL